MHTPARRSFDDVVATWDDLAPVSLSALLPCVVGPLAKEVDRRESAGAELIVAGTAGLRSHDDRRVIVDLESTARAAA